MALRAKLRRLVVSRVHYLFKDIGIGYR